MIKVSSEPELRDARGRIIHAGEEAGSPVDGFVVPRAVLIIRQTRETHDEIATVIRRVEQGDVLESEQPGFGGAGGFGGGYFSVGRP